METRELVIIGTVAAFVIAFLLIKIFWKRTKKEVKVERTTKPRVTLGYVIHVNGNNYRLSSVTKNRKVKVQNVNNGRFSYLPISDIEKHHDFFVAVD